MKMTDEEISKDAPFHPCYSQRASLQDGKEIATLKCGAARKFLGKLQHWGNANEHCASDKSRP